MAALRQDKAIEVPYTILSLVDIPDKAIIQHNARIVPISTDLTRGHLLPPQPPLHPAVHHMGDAEPPPPIDTVRKAVRRTGRTERLRGDEAAHQSSPSSMTQRSGWR